MAKSSLQDNSNQLLQRALDRVQQENDRLRRELEEKEPEKKKSQGLDTGSYRPDFDLPKGAVKPNSPAHPDLKDVSADSLSGLNPMGNDIPADLEGVTAESLQGLNPMGADIPIEGAAAEAGASGSTAGGAGTASYAWPIFAYLGLRATGNALDETNEVPKEAVMSLKYPVSGTGKVLGDTLADVTGMKEASKPTDRLNDLERGGQNFFEDLFSWLF